MMLRECSMCAPVIIIHMVRDCVIANSALSTLRNKGFGLLGGLHSIFCFCTPMYSHDVLPCTPMYSKYSHVLQMYSHVLLCTPMYSYVLRSTLLGKGVHRITQEYLGVLRSTQEYIGVHSSPRTIKCRVGADGEDRPTPLIYLTSQSEEQKQS